MIGSKPATCARLRARLTSNEAIDATDWKITGDLTLNLRAARSNRGTGRIYTIAIDCVDGSGNVSAKTATVTGPR